GVRPSHPTASVLWDHAPKGLLSALAGPVATLVPGVRAYPRSARCCKPRISALSGAALPPCPCPPHAGGAVSRGQRASALGDPRLRWVVVRPSSDVASTFSRAEQPYRRRSAFRGKR